MFKSIKSYSFVGLSSQSVSREKRVPAGIVALYGDDSGDAATFRALYSAWTVMFLAFRLVCIAD